MSTQGATDVEVLKMSIAQRIREARSRKGWSQEQAAKALRCSRIKLNRVERGRAELTTSEIALLARELNVSVDFFFS